MLFEELGLKEIQSAALARLGIESLTAMQEACLFACREPQDVILLSPTGSGKTLASLLPLLEHLSADAGTAGPQALVVVPSRELALQTETVFRDMGTAYKAMAVYGGRPAMDEHRTMNALHPALVIGTPGRLVDHLSKGNIDGTTVRTLIIDEFDKCLELGFHDEMATLVSMLPHLQQRLLMSATDIADTSAFAPRKSGKRSAEAERQAGTVRAVAELGAVARKDAERMVEADMAAGMTAPAVVDPAAFVGMRRYVKLDYREGTASRLTVSFVRSPEKDKLNTLYRLLCSLGGEQAIVFCNYREAVERVGEYLRSQRLAHSIYHGGLEQELRERALSRFRSGSANVLVSTDLASRGLDIPEVRHIIHYHLPANDETYVHRVGRTARWDADGSSCVILGPEETLPDCMAGAFETVLPLRPGRPTAPHWELLYIGKGKKDKLSRGDIVGFLCKKGGLTMEEIGRIDVRERCCYVAVRRDKVRQMLALLAGEKIKGMKTLIEVAR